MPNVTEILSAAEAGDPQAAADLLPLVYNELRKLAAMRMAAEAVDHTLQPTALVHEAYLRLVGSSPAVSWSSRGHFFAAAAEAMRRILIESARRKATSKRGERPPRIALDPDNLSVPVDDSDRWLDLDEALNRFDSIDPTAASIAKLRLFTGLTVDEAANVLGISRAHAFRMWTYARAWLSDALAEKPEGR